MVDELQVAVVNDPDIVAVPQPDIQVLTETTVTPIVITTPEVEVVTLDGEDHIVDQVREIQIVTVGEQGPQGIQGPSGSGVAETYTAVTDLGGHRVVVTDASGGLIYADVTNQAHAHQAVRITTQAARAGGGKAVRCRECVTDRDPAGRPLGVLESHRSRGDEHSHHTGQ